MGCLFAIHAITQNALSLAICLLEAIKIILMTWLQRIATCLEKKIQYQSLQKIRLEQSIDSMEMEYHKESWQEVLVLASQQCGKFFMGLGGNVFTMRSKTTGRKLAIPFEHKDAIGGFGLVHTDATNSRIIEWTCDSV